MKKFTMIILVIGFAFGAKAQNSPGTTVEVNNDCVQEATEGHYEAKQKKKRKNRTAVYSGVASKSFKNDSPYKFANSKKESDKSDVERINVMIIGIKKD